jgi:hypothetical protein
MRHFKLGICALLGYYAALSDISVPTFRDKNIEPIFKGQEVQVQEIFLDFLILDDETDILSRNVDTELLLNAA